MNHLIRFVKEWTLPCAIVAGTALYLLFSEVPQLEPVGDRVGPALVGLMPYVIFVMLFASFCKINLPELRPHRWHFWIQAIRIALSGLMVLLISQTENPQVRLIEMGIFICFISPTAAASPVVTEKLGGNISSLTAFLILANLVTAIVIPLFFPMVKEGIEMPFVEYSLLVLQRVTLVLLLPLVLSLLARRYAPRLADWFARQRNLSFYLWCVNLAISMGVTWQNLLRSDAHGWTLALLLLAPAAVCFLLFTIGKAVGRAHGDSITAGQALGQKNTAVAIWLTLSFLDPVTAIAPGAYIIWQNIVNSWQLWYKKKYGYLRW